MSDDYTTVQWRGIRFAFTKTQAAVAKLLIQAAGKTLSEEAILDRAGSAGSRIRDIFKRGNQIHPALGQMLVRELKGIWRFVPECEIPHEHPTLAPALPQNKSHTSPDNSGTNAAYSNGRASMSTNEVADLVNEFLFSLAERDMPRAFALAMRIWNATSDKSQADLPGEFNERRVMFDELFGAIEYNMTPGGTLADLDDCFQDLAEKLYPSDEKFTQEIPWRIAKHSATRHRIRIEAIAMADARAREVTNLDQKFPEDERRRRNAEDQRRSEWELQYFKQLDRERL